MVQSNETLLEVKDLKMHFPVTSGVIFQHKIADIKAVDGVSFSIKKGESVLSIMHFFTGPSPTDRRMLLN